MNLLNLLKTHKGNDYFKKYVTFDVQILFSYDNIN